MALSSRPVTAPIRMAHAAFPWTAILVVGGRGSRLGHRDKSALIFDGETLLDRAITSTRLARSTVVVGIDDHRRVRGPVVVAHEEPRFGGPALSVIAGLAQADAGDDDMVALLAGDVPRLPEVLPLLIARWWGVQNSGGSIAPADGVIAVDDDGRRQPLLSLVRADRLRTAIAYRPRPLDWVNASMTSLLAPLALVPVTLSHGMARDVDTPDDAQHFGIVLDEPRAAVLQ